MRYMKNMQRNMQNMHTHTHPYLFLYDTKNEYDGICKNNMQNMHIPHFWHTQNCKVWKNAECVWNTRPTRCR